MSVKVERIASLLKKELSMLLQNETKNTKIGFVTIIDLKTTKDLALATVYYSIIGEEKRVEVTQKGLEEAAGYLRSELAKRITNIRKVPQLVFKYDESLAYGNKIEKLLKDIHQES